MTDKPKVAILGGGMGAIAAAYELEASCPGGFEITVYEREWRLGGKCASGRNLAAGFGNRIEEHGLHVLMGFYQNTFEILANCYADLRRKGTLPASTGPKWWNGVLRGLDTIYFAEPAYDSGPSSFIWQVPFRTTNDEIGGPSQPLPSISAMAYALFKRFLLTMAEHQGSFERAGPLLHGLKVASADTLREYARDPARRQAFIDVLTNSLESAWEAVRNSLSNTRAYKWFVVIYFAGANLLAMMTDVLPHEANFRDRLDEYDYKDWIRSYNCLHLPDRFLAESALVNAVYDLVFSRGKGFGAGFALYDTLLMLLHYSGHIFYKMLGGMGDVIFAPLYLWLKDRGVCFKFFHDLRDIQLSADQKRVEALVFDLSNPFENGGYDPLIGIDCFDDLGNPVRLPCWPNRPTVEPLEVPRRITISDFDFVVLGISVGAFAHARPGERPLCQNLFVDRNFEQMSKSLITRPTRAVQLWFSCDLKELGWPPPGSGVLVSEDPAAGPVLGSYRPDLHYNSWADMSQVLRRETWETEKPRNIAYLCDVLDPADETTEPNQTVHDDAVKWLQEAASGLWSAAKAGFPWERLVDSGAAKGQERFESQYWRANTDASQRYVLGAPGTGKARLTVDGTAFSNLYLAGDWVKTELNAGCVEAAAMAGREAARRILASRERREPFGATSAPPTGARSTRTPYIQRDGDLPLEHPVSMRDVSLHAFIFKADRRALNAMLDQAFGEAGVSCRALLPLVFVTTINAQQIRSTVRPQDGYMSERELGFWVPVLVSSPGGSQIAFYIPYLFVDNPAALSAGRDIYGFNKIFGQFDVSAAEETTPAEVRAQVLPTFAPDTQVNWKPVTRFMGKLSPDQQRWSAAESTFADVVSAMFEHLDAQDATIARSGISTFARQIPLLFLKQFRDAGDGADACYRRVICANAVLDGKFEAGWLSHGGLRLELGEYASMNLCESLGLVQSLSPQIAFWARLSAMVGRGHEFDSNGNSQRERA